MKEKCATKPVNSVIVENIASMLESIFANYHVLNIQIQRNRVSCFSIVVYGFLENNGQMFLATSNVAVSVKSVDAIAFGWRCRINKYKVPKNTIGK